MSDLGYSLKVLRRIGLLGVQNPVKLAGAGAALARWGTALPAGVNAAASRFPDQIAIIDDAGQISWKDLARQVNQVSALLKSRGIGPGDSVAVLQRNHRWMVICLVALMQCGARILLLNTMASRSQLSDLAEREGAQLMLCDEEFLPVIAADTWAGRVFVAWADGPLADGNGLHDAAKVMSDKAHRKPAKAGRIVIFTSGTTGLPKGAKREEPKDLRPLLTFFGSIPYHANQRVIVAAPLFHSWGLLNFAFGLITAPTYILRRKFSAEQVITDIATYRASVLVVVPLMMQRMIEVPKSFVADHDVSSLKITASSGSALPGELATTFMDMFTDSVYNFYGATETGWVTIAGPQDLRAAPGTAGTVPWHTTVQVLDHDGNEVPTGQTGVIHVKNEMMFGGYTDGNTKAFEHGLMNTGDLGHFDESGRLFVSGRDDDMIISGGENVFPRELEDALIGHDDVQDVVVTGVEDEQWGQRLAAYVVLQPGRSLTEEQLISYAHETVPRFAVPKRVVFLDELPRNPTGKVMKRALPGLDTL